ncbi:hypothetical protein H8F21_13785 [Pseudomonas sp. P66]|uniref:Uncharacterized protein n=1 Tax=Pseudomonas arcuscaelestis TaxID=2710591 RepID=A0ABS2BYD3_9PSED|nr:hypothetical protein [Pseudomonas arcuscaelestis]MBM5458636.1 hypothetical protein [Pseudomonas arcuscaelestis]
MQHYDEIISQAQSARAAGSPKENPYPAGSTAHAFFEHGWNQPRLPQEAGVVAGEVQRLRSELEYARTFEASAAYHAGLYEGTVESRALLTSFIELLSDARHRVANLSPGPVPFEHPLDGPVLRRLDLATEQLLTTTGLFPSDGAQALVRHPPEQIKVWADMYTNMGGHALMVEMLLAYHSIATNGGSSGEAGSGKSAEQAQMEA